MNEAQKRNIDLLNSIKDGFKYDKKEYENIVKNSSETLMSKTNNVSFFGMFLPCEKLQEIFIYKGKLVKDEAKCDYTYYFDKDKRLVLTKRYYKGSSSLSLIFYYYHESYIDLVWYDPDCIENEKSFSKNTIKMVGRIEIPDGILTRWLLGDSIRENIITSYHEYLFTVKKRWVYERQFWARLSNLGEKDEETVSWFTKAYGV